MKKSILLCLTFLLFVLTGIIQNGQAQVAYDIVILNGRVIDPETNYDHIDNVGIKDGSIVIITTEKISGSKTIDATGLIVSPGFIDLHSHSFELTGNRMQAFDGVTTQLEMESGILPIAKWYDAVAKEGRSINYGGTTSWSFARIIAMQPEMPPVAATAEWYGQAFRYNKWTTQPSTDQELEKILSILEEGLKEGAIGIGVNSGYVPGVGGKELKRVWELAAKYNVPVSTHMRDWSLADPNSSVEGLNMVIGMATTTGAKTNVCHLHSTLLKDGPTGIKMLERARAEGVDITSEAYPYGIATMPISSSVLLLEGDNFRQRMGVDFDAIRLIAKQRWITDEKDLRNEQKSDPGQLIVFKYLDEDKPEEESVVTASMTSKWMAVASDAVPWNNPDGSTVTGTVWPLTRNMLSNPRSAGCFSKFLGTWVRERGLLSWPDALRKVTLLPAQLVEEGTPMMKKKGRLQTGMDADITIFDPKTITDRATIDYPAQTSEGVKYLIVNGQLLIENEKMDLTIFPGKPIRR